MEREIGVEAKVFFLQKYLRDFIEKCINEKSLRIEKEVDLKNPKFNINTIRVSTLSGFLEKDKKEKVFTKEEFDNGDLDLLILKIDEKLRKHVSSYFYKKSYKATDVDYSFFNYLTNKDNIENVWSNLNNRDKYALFTYLISRNKGKIDAIINILEPEEYSRLFRINYKREEMYVAKEAASFFDRIEFFKRTHPIEETAELVKKIYNNVDNREKNIIVNGINSHKVFQESIFKNLGLKEVIDYEQDKNTFDEFEELLNAQVKKHENVSFVFDLSAKILGPLLKEQTTFIGLQKIISSLNTHFIIGKEYFLIENGKYLPGEQITYSDNFRIKISCIRGDMYSTADKEHREKILKKLIVKYFVENLRKFSGQDPNGYNTVEGNFKENYILLEKQDREDYLVKNMKEIDKVERVTIKKKI